MLKSMTNINTLSISELKFENCGDLDELIEEMEKLVPDKRKKKEYIDWKNKINYLYQNYNKLAKFKCYKLI